MDQVWTRFLDALEPLHEAGRLGSLLLQFPPWFGIRKDHEHYILECKRRCETRPLAQLPLRGRGRSRRRPDRAR